MLGFAHRGNSGIGVSTEAAETASNFGLDAWLAIVSAQPANPLWAQKAPQIGPELQQFAPTACADGLRSDLQHPSARKTFCFEAQSA